MNDQSSAKASRAIGAMFFSIFGGAWMVVWSLEAYDVSITILSIIAAATLFMLLASIRQYRQNRIAHAAEANSPVNKRAGKIFNIVNAIQWTLVFIIANVLSSLGYKEWIIPSIIFIVGAHFIPLASAFRIPRHNITGIALIILAVVYPLIMKNGPANPIGCLGAGIILWASAAAALIPNASLSSEQTTIDS